jgi:hypothetical protein
MIELLLFFQKKKTTIMFRLAIGNECDSRLNTIEIPNELCFSQVIQIKIGRNQWLNYR